MTGNVGIKRETKEFGDFQTPDSFVKRINKYLVEELNINPTVVLEPTFGVGSFIYGSIRDFTKLSKIIGIELNKDYYDKVRETMSSKGNLEIELYNEDFFTFDFDKIKGHLSKDEEFLIIGNPPWVTNSGLGSIMSGNVPLKTNFKRLNGFDALTGKSNFDIAEYIILQLLSEFSRYNCVLAMLCKTVVARNIIRDLHKYSFHVSDAKLILFNAREVFNSSSEAGLLVIRMGQEETRVCDVYDFSDLKTRKKTFGWVDEHFVSNIDNYLAALDAEGISPYEWRQGVKHDCSMVMELTSDKHGVFRNSFGETVEIENGFVYPLVKSSDLKRPLLNKTKKYVIITQKKVKEETSKLSTIAPRLWKYLSDHTDLLDKRKSSIYKNSPKFSIFGIGEYSFKPYKVVISGFYKKPIFSLVYSDDKTPIMVDDTCYFLGFDNYVQAYLVMLLLNSNIVQNFLQSVAFLDMKRPYTKEILSRIDLRKVTTKTDFVEVEDISKRLGLSNSISKGDYERFAEKMEIEVLA